MAHPYEFALAIEVSRFLQELSHHAKAKGRSTDQAAYQFVQLMKSDPDQASEAVQELISGFNSTEPMRGKVTLKSALSELLGSDLSDDDVEAAVNYVLKTVLVTVATQAGRVDLSEVVHNAISIIRTVSQKAAPKPTASSGPGESAAVAALPSDGDDGDGEGKDDGDGSDSDVDTEDGEDGDDGGEASIEEARESLKDKLKEAEAKAADVILRGESAAEAAAPIVGVSSAEAEEAKETPQAPAPAAPEPAPAEAPAAPAPAAPAPAAPPAPTPAPATRKIRLPGGGSDARSTTSRATAVSAAKSMQDPGLIRTILSRVRARR